MTASKYIKQKLSEVKGEITTTLMVGVFNTSPLEYRNQKSSKIQKTHPDSVWLHINPLDLIDLSRTLAEYTLFSNAHRAFIKIGEILGHKNKSQKFKCIKSNKACSLITIELFFISLQ